MRPAYPRSFAEMPTWATENGVTVGEARLRFAQYGVLSAVVRVPALRDALVFKGGNALDFIWQPNRSTIDLDFSLDPIGAFVNPDADIIKRLFERGLASVTTGVGTAFAVHRVRLDPPGQDKTFVTYNVRIGYAHRDEVRLRQRMAQGEPSPNVVKVDISLNEPICDVSLLPMDEAHRLRVATIEDIVAEKLRALLQQPIRRRERRQDLLDIAVILRTGHQLDRAHVAAYLQTKAAARAVTVSRAAFFDPEIAQRAREGYAELAETARVTFVPFEEALALLRSFVNELAIPE